MLASFRKMAGGFVAKILLGFLVLTFALWGVGDVFRSGGASTTLATVGSKSITQGDLVALTETLQRSYPEITAEMAADPTFKMEILNSLINREIMKMQATELGIEFSSEALAGYIAQNENFKNTDGGFDRQRFIETLRQNNMTERAFLSRFSQDLATSTIEDTIAVGWLPSEAMLGLQHFLRNEKREASLIVLTDKDAGKVKEPDADDMKKLYASEQARFTIPQRRSLLYASFSADDALEALKISASEETLRTLYEERKDSYKEPEKREVSQLLFTTQEDATKAHDMLNAKKSWAEVSALKSVQNKDNTNLGSVTQIGLPDEAAKSVFVLKEKEFTPPIQTGFGWHIFLVKKIEAARAMKFDEVKEQLAKEYQAEQSEAELSKLAGSIEDAIAGGSSIKQALKQNGLASVSLHTMNGLTADGRDATGKIHALKPLQMDALAQAFTLDEQEASSVNLSTDERYYVVQTTKIEPEMVKPIAEVEKELAALYKERATKQALHAHAVAIAKKLKDAENPMQASKDLGLSLHSSGTLTRTQETIGGNSQLKGKNLTTGFVMELFRLRVPETTAPYPLPDGGYVIGILDAIHPAKPATPDELAELEKEMTATMAQEAMHHYIGFLRRHYKVDVKTELLLGSADTSSQ